MENKQKIENELKQVLSFLFFNIKNVLNFNKKQCKDLSHEYYRKNFELRESYDIANQSKFNIENEKNDLIEKLRHIEQQFNDLTENFEIQKKDLEEQKAMVNIK